MEVVVFESPEFLYDCQTIGMQLKSFFAIVDESCLCVGLTVDSFFLESTMGLLLIFSLIL